MSDENDGRQADDMTHTADTTGAYAQDPYGDEAGTLPDDEQLED